MHINKLSQGNTGKQMVHVFDVDGTLTHHDSFILLIRFLLPSFFQQIRFCFELIPTALVAALTMQPQKLKLAILKKLWQHRQAREIDKICEVFFREKLRSDIRSAALLYIKQLQQCMLEGKIVLLSASCNAWLQPLAAYLNATLICTQLDYDEKETFTGRFATPNCKGKEKVRRLLQMYPSEDYRFVCYADSPADKYLQTISEQFYYRYF